MRDRDNHGQTPSASPDTREPVFRMGRPEGSPKRYEISLEVSGGVRSWSVFEDSGADAFAEHTAIPVPELGSLADLFDTDPSKTWDSGTYNNLTISDGALLTVEEALKLGRMVIWLNGRRVQGGYLLNRRAFDEREIWSIRRIDSAIEPP